MSAPPSTQDAYNELSFYTLTHGDPAFVHQHAADAYAAQNASAEGKPNSAVFALIGLYLHVEKGYSGREVQRAHTRLAGKRRIWPRLPLPSNRGALTVRDVVATVPGPARDQAIEAWCVSVWNAYGDSHGAIADLARSALGI